MVKRCFCQELVCNGGELESHSMKIQDITFEVFWDAEAESNDFCVMFTDTYAGSSPHIERYDFLRLVDWLKSPANINIQPYVEDQLENSELGVRIEWKRRTIAELHFPNSEKKIRTSELLLDVYFRDVAAIIDEQIKFHNYYKRCQEIPPSQPRFGSIYWW